MQCISVSSSTLLTEADKLSALGASVGVSLGAPQPATMVAAVKTAAQKNTLGDWDKRGGIVAVFRESALLRIDEWGPEREVSLDSHHPEW